MTMTALEQLDTSTNLNDWTAMPKSSRYPSILRFALLALVAMAIGSCASREAAKTPGARAAVPEAETEPPETTRAPAEGPGAAATTREEIVERGTGDFLGPDSTERVQVEEGEINLRFENTDIQEFVNVVLGDLLGVNYVVDPNVTGTVTINTSTPIPEDQLLPLFEEILSINDTALVRSDGVYHVVPQSVVASVRSPLSINGAADSGFRTQVIPLDYISAQEMLNILEKVVPDPGAIRIDVPRNIIIASGTADEVATIRDTIDVFDVDWLRGMSVGLYPLDNVDPETLETELTSVLAAATGPATGDVLGGIVRLVPLERLTSLLVVSSTPNALREVETWIRRLDRPGESSGRSLYVYPVQNAKAGELAEILGTIFGSQANPRRSTTSDRAMGESSSSALAPGLSPVRIGPSTNAQAGDAPVAPGGGQTTSGTADAADAPTSTGSRAGLTLTGGEAIRIIADDVRNALVVLATPQEYRMVEATLRKLDVVPLQVLIEARILEVQLRDDLSYGVEWFFKNSLDAGTKAGRGALDLGSPGITALAPGFSYTVVDSADQVRVALNLLASESEVNVLSSPSLMVLDNQTATINVGDEIPVPTRQSISNIDPTSPTVNEISFRQTGITLSVTPRVNNSGLVTMDIRQEVATAATTTTSNIDAPTIQNRQIESVVAINSGETIVLGGLMQNQESMSEDGLPGLRRIPGLGKLFSRATNEHSRTELLVLITPQVVRNRDDARRVTDEFRRKLMELQMAIPHQTNASSDDKG